MRSIFQYRHPPTPKAELKHVYIVELWRHYRPLGGRDDHADLIHALIRKLIVQQARDIPMELERTADSLTSNHTAFRWWTGTKTGMAWNSGSRATERLMLISWSGLSTRETAELNCLSVNVRTSSGLIGSCRCQSVFEICNFRNLLNGFLNSGSSRTCPPELTG
jgi:hypothetical protein